MQKELTFVKENGQWYIDLPNWVGPKSALLMVGGAHDILEQFSSESASDVVAVKVSTKDTIYSHLMKRSSYTLLGGAYYDYKGTADVWLCPVTLFVFGRYPEMLSFEMAC